MMQEYLAENARLRQYSKRYAAGEISLEEFREVRRAILASLEEGMAEPQAVEVDIERALPVVAAADTQPGQRMAEPHDDITLFTPAQGSPVLPPSYPPEESFEAEAESPEVAQAQPTAAPVSRADAPGMDRHSMVLLVIIVLALVVALGALGYVLLL